MPSEQMAWIDPSATTTLLDGSGAYKAIYGRNGIWDTPREFLEYTVPNYDGAFVRFVKLDPANPLLPVWITGADESALAAAMRTLRSAMNPKRGAGKLQYTSADSTVRQLNCYLQAGLEADESQGNRAFGKLMAALQFHAPDPLWYDASSTVVTRTTFGAFTVTNTGDVEFWPQWSIHGPTTNLTITNTTTGQSMVFTLTLGGSDILTIDTTPLVKTVLLNGTTNEYAAMSNTSSLFSFATGANVLNFTLSGTTGSTSIQLTYKQRYLGV